MSAPTVSAFGTSTIDIRKLRIVLGCVVKRMLTFIIVFLTIAPSALDAGKKGQPKNMRIYAAECADVLDPLRELLEDRNFFVVDEDVDDDGDIEMELARGGGFGKRSKARGLVRLIQRAERCTVVIDLEQRDPLSHSWHEIHWREKKFFAPLDARFLQAE